METINALEYFGWKILNPSGAEPEETWMPFADAYSLKPDGTAVFLSYEGEKGWDGALLQRSSLQYAPEWSGDFAPCPIPWEVIERLNVMEYRNRVKKFPLPWRDWYYCMIGKPISLDSAFEIMSRTGKEPSGASPIYSLFDMCSWAAAVYYETHSGKYEGLCLPDGRIWRKSALCRWPELDETIKGLLAGLAVFPFLDLLMAVVRPEGFDSWCRFPEEREPFYENICCMIHVRDGRVELTEPDRELFMDYMERYYPCDGEKVILETPDYVRKGNEYYLTPAFVKRLGWK